MPTDEDKEMLKKAFRDVDRTGAGCFARKDLMKVFQELETWTEEDLEEMFDSFDTKKDGTVSYNDMVDWIMSDEDDEENEREDSDDDDAEDLEELDEAADELGLDLDERVTKEQWTKIARAMDIDEDEADDIHEEVLEEAQEGGRDYTGGIPLWEFMDDLQVEPEDTSELKFFKTAIERMKRGELDTSAKATHAVNIAIDKAVRLLDQSKKPPEEAWELAFASGELSKAGARVLRAKFTEDKAGFIERVKAAMITPPLIPSLAGKTGNREHCSARVTEIIKRCKEKGEKFTDSDWDVTTNPNAVLYVDKEKSGWDCTVATPAAYKRLSEISEDPVLFRGGIGAGDIKQGQIGTCFLLGAMGAVCANNSRGIEKIFIKHDIDVGVYGVRFCVHGEWTHVIVDDIVPVDADGNVLFAHSANKSELWVTLCEKAFCKLYTCYEMCDGGRPMEAVFSLFGGVSGKFEIGKAQKADPTHFFKVLKTARGSGWLLTTAFVISKNAKKGGGKCGEAVLPTGLVGGHVYSVLKVKEACGVRFVQCRNPWGTGEWKGRYSDKNEFGEWTDELKDALDYQGRNDGKFWMSIEDFVQNSGGVEYARTFGPEWKKVTQYKSFQEGAMQASALWAYKSRAKDELSIDKGATIEVLRIAKGWWYGNVLGSPDTRGHFPGNYVKLANRPVARFDLQGTPAANSDKPVTVVVSLMQPNKKMKRKWVVRPDGMNYKDVKYPGLQIVVVGPTGKAVLNRSGKKRCVSGELKLPGGGLWKIYALSTAGTGADFSLRAYVKNGTATLTEVPAATLSEIMDEIIL